MSSDVFERKDYHEIEVTKWVSYESEYADSINWMGGWFDEGLRWKDYLKEMEFTPEQLAYVEAVRRSVLDLKIKRGGDWHQNSSHGVPLFSDKTVARFSMRAWGDLMAAIWSTEDNKDYEYMDFYMQNWGSVLGGGD